MSEALVDISDALEWAEDLPRPRWDLIASRIDATAGGAADEAWTCAARRWLERLRDALGAGYVVEESPRTLLLAPEPEPSAEALLGFVAECRRVLTSALPGVADFGRPGKQVLVVLPTPDVFYRYIAPFYPEGRWGGFSGMHLRDGYPHIAVCGFRLGDLERIVAHEMTHASLAHLSLPAWVEEGLAQMFEHDLGGGSGRPLDPRAGRKQKEVWGRRGLGEFWSGAAFHRAGKVQELAYQLAEVLVRLLIEEHRPAWFGLSRTRQQRLLSFLKHADAADAGEAAAREHLALGLDEIAALFLGPGDWKPSVSLDEDLSVDGARFGSLSGDSPAFP